jgi:hypothetical protein
MLADAATQETRAVIRFRFLMIPIVSTLALFVCFWSATILLSVYALLLPFYVIPVKAEAAGMTQKNEKMKSENRKPKTGEEGERLAGTPLR